LTINDFAICDDPRALPPKSELPAQQQQQRQQLLPSPEGGRSEGWEFARANLLTAIGNNGALYNMSMHVHVFFRTNPVLLYCICVRHELQKLGSLPLLRADVR